MLTRSANASPDIHAFHYAPSHSPRQSPPSRNSAAPAPPPTTAPARRPSSSSSAVSASIAVAAAAIAQISVSAGQPASSPASSLSPPIAPLAVTALRSSADHHPSQPYPAPAPSAAPVYSSSLPGPSPPPPPPSTRPPRYVAVDAATQYSPTASFDDTPAPSHPPQHRPAAAPTTPMTPGTEQGAGPASDTVGTGHKMMQTQSLQVAPGAPAPLAPDAPVPVPASTETRAPPSAGPASIASSFPNTNNPPSNNDKAPSPASAASALQQQAQRSPYVSSPQKRRNSQSQESHVASTAQLSEGNAAAAASQTPMASSAAPAEAESSSSAAKRARSEVAPPKMLPEQYEFCPVEDMVVLIANMLGELIETNDALALKSGHLTRFHSRTAPGISVLDYLHRLAKHATLIPPLLLSMVYYIDRLCAMYPDFTINTLTVHRFLITAATVAAKGLSDSFWNNSTYARVGGVRVNELKMLELEFLYRLEWKIVPNPEVLAAYYRPLVERCPGYTLPPDTSAANSRSPSDDEDEMDDGGDVIGSSQVPPKVSHHRKSSTSLIGEDMVVSGLARSKRQDRG